MSKVDDLRSEFRLPPLSQIGVVVRDVETTAAFYTSMFGIGPFKIDEFAPDRYRYRGVQTRFREKLGKAMLGSVELELLEGPAPYFDALETRGEGPQHVAFNVPNYDDVFDRFVKAGFQPLAEFQSYLPAYQGHLRCCFFDTERIGGVMFEFAWRSWLVPR